MQTRFIWLQAVTSVHVGAGQTASLIDLPVIREAKTNYPFLPGSGLKGALRDEFRLTIAKKAKQEGKTYADTVREADRSEQVERLFGKQESAGRLLIGDGKLAFIPMRSLEHAFVWVTCPYLIRRLSNDLAFAGIDVAIDNSDLDTLIKASDGEALFAGESIHVEDYHLKPAGGSAGFDPVAFFEPFGFPDQYARRQSFKNVVIVNDSFFNYLVSRRLPVRSRNRLEPLTKTVANGALWTEESLPPETILYTVIADRSPEGDAVAEFEKAEVKRLQVGGNETVGEGWLSLAPFGEHIS